MKSVRYRTAFQGKARVELTAGRCAWFRHTHQVTVTPGEPLDVDPVGAPESEAAFRRR